MLAGAVLLAATAVLSERSLARMLAPSTRVLRAAGEFVQANTAKDDYVVYVVAGSDDNPTFLYFAQRHGRNMAADAITLDAVHAAGAVAPRTFVYASRIPAATSLLADPRWLRVAEHEHGVLLAARER